MSAVPHSDDPLAGGDAVLGVFAKAPVAGAVKTRLAAATSPEWAARVADAFLRDTVDRFAALPVRRVLAYSPSCAREFFVNVAGSRYDLEAQGDGDLGRRMEAFFRSQFDRGAGRVVLIGTDSPTVPVEHVAEAFERLRVADVVLGPATDGGYYLIGCARAVPPIFHGIDWGGATVLAETVACLAESVTLSILPPWYDVDTLDDWQTLRGHLLAWRRSGGSPLLSAIECLINSQDADEFCQKSQD